MSQRELLQHLQLAHRLLDKEYADYKAGLLEYLTDVKVIESSSKALGKKYPTVVVRTLSHPFYNKLFEHMYFNGRKTTTEHIMGCLTPLGLALWYLDDGTLAGEMGFRNPFICSHNFNQLENQMMCWMIHKMFGVTFRTIKKNIKDKTYYWMRLRRKDRERFFNIVRPFVPKCMERKINPNFYKNDENYQKKKREVCVVCGKEFEIKMSSISKHCSRSCWSRTANKTKRKNVSVEKKCKYCECLFTVPYRLRYRRQYCSRKCAGHSKGSASVEKKCKYCQLPFTVPYHERHRQYCSHKCSSLSRRCI